MQDNAPGEKLSQGYLKDVCRQAIDLLNRESDLSTEDVVNQVDQAENLVVELRNGLIERLRAANAKGTQMPSSWRQPLDCVNVSLSLIVGVAYPGSQIHRNYVREAHRVLVEVEKMLDEVP